MEISFRKDLQTGRRNARLRHWIELSHMHRGSFVQESYDMIDTKYTRCEEINNYGVSVMTQVLYMRITSTCGLLYQAQLLSEVRKLLSFLFFMQSWWTSK